MLYFDVTKASGFRHKSGLGRVSAMLRKHLSDVPGGFTEVVWHPRAGTFVERTTRRPFQPSSADRLLTPEVFSPDERRGFAEWLHRRPCGTVAIYHDAIPIRFPEITWPHSVARHPHYLKLLASFDQVLAISEASARELRDYWRWIGCAGSNPVALRLGADGLELDRAAAGRDISKRKSVLVVGIVEPRKNQTAILDAAEALWSEGVEFDLTFAGRVNPHFGRPIARRMKALARDGCALVHLASATDADVARLFGRARFTMMPSLAEGCGLPLLESLWAGVPVICSDVPALNENAAGGGCLSVGARDGEQLRNAMRCLLEDDSELDCLASEARSRKLPTWRETAASLINLLA